MKVSHPKYILKSNDTLQKITELFGVEEDVWKRYHNNMCRLDDVIRDTLPKHLEEIYLLPELWGKVNELSNGLKIKEKYACGKVVLGYNNTLHQKVNIITIKYGVKIIIQNGEKETSIKYELSINKKGRVDNNFLMEINRLSLVYIDDMYPDLMVDRLAADTFEMVYPLLFLVDKNGCIVDLFNFEEIKDRWSKGKDQLREGRKGEWLEKYLRMTDKCFSRKENFLSKLKNDWFLHSFFLGIYQTYTSNYEIERDVFFPFVQNMTGVQYHTKQRIDKCYDNYNMIQVMIEGKVSDKRSVKDFGYKLNYPCFDDSKLLEGNYYSKYFVDPKTNLIDTMITECTLNLEKPKKITIKASSFT